MAQKNGKFCVFILAAVITAHLSGCIDEVEPTAPAPSQSVSVETPWHTHNGQSAIAVASDTDQVLLEQAAAQARATVDEARTQWLATPEVQRGNWAIKWAIELENGSIEHVWVQPLHWSAFRIEGLLLSDVLTESDDAYTRGQLVSFPVEQLTDWVYQSNGERRGGYSMRVLEDQYGQPPAQ